MHSSPHDAVTPPAEQVVLLTPDGRACGTADKAGVHDAQTPLHLAFSCHLVDPGGAVLVTRRASTKRAFGGVWTNTACGHPAPGESLTAAAQRRLRDELGVTLPEGSTVRLVLPAFGYRATDASGVVEHELCPVLVVLASARPETTPAAEEVDDLEWLPWAQFSAEVASGERTVSPWCALQVEQLAPLGPDPAAWPEGDPALLPPAARA